MAFTHIQGGAAVGSSTAPSVTLTGVTAGSTLCVAIIAEASSTTCTVSGFTATPNSPSTFVTGGGQVFLFYKINVASGNTTITGTLGATQSWTIWAEEFGASGGTSTFDKDAAGSTTASETSITTPSITPTNSASLLFSACACVGSGSAPAAGGTAGVWTGSAGGINHGNISEYDLSATGATAVNYTQGTGAGHSSMVMAFFISSGPTVAQEAPNWYTDGEVSASARSQAGARELYCHHELYTADTYYLFLPILDKGVVSSSQVYPEHLDHPNVQSPWFNKQDVDMERWTQQIVLDKGVVASSQLYEEHLSHPEIQSPTVSNLASDSGQDSTGFIILPPVPLVDEQCGGLDCEE